MSTVPFVIILLVPGLVGSHSFQSERGFHERRECEHAIVDMSMQYERLNGRKSLVRAFCVDRNEKIK